MKYMPSIQACGCEFTLSNALVFFEQISVIDKEKEKDKKLWLESKAC